MKRKYGFISNTLVTLPQDNDVLAFDSQEEVWKNKPATSLTTITVGDIHPTPNDKGAIINSQNELQLCAADSTHRGVLYGQTNYIPTSETDTNTTLGYQSGGSIASPNKENITAVGYKAYKNYVGQWTGKNTTVIGQRALENTQNISDSTVIGCEAGAVLQDLIPGNPPSAGNDLIAIGYGAAGRNTSKTIRKAFNCIYIGNNTDSTTQDASEQIVLGHGAIGSNQELTIGSYIERAKWPGLNFHTTGASPRHFHLTVDQDFVMRRFQTPSWRVRMNNAYSIPNGPGFNIPFDTLVFETGVGPSFYNPTTGNYTCPINGIYWVEATIRFDITTTTLHIWIARDGSSVPAAPYDRRVGSGSSPTTLHCSGLWSCAQGQTLTVFASHGLGSSLGILSGHFCMFSGYWVGPNF